MRPLGPTLDAFLADFDYQGHVLDDPIRFPRRFDAPADQEVVGLFAACLAYGRASLIGRACEDLLLRIGPHPAQASEGDDLEAARRRFEGFVYRMTRPEDLARLWLGVGHARRAHGSLLAAFRAGDPGGTEDLRAGLTAFRALLRAPTEHLEPRRSFAHLLSNPAGQSPSKRLALFMRWMVRRGELDLGLWAELGAHRLLIPLDTHVHRIGRYLGLTERGSASWKTAAEITASLRRLDPVDPLRYDFALAHMGISGRCPTRRVEAICADCPINSVCRLDHQGSVVAQVEDA